MQTLITALIVIAAASYVGRRWFIGTKSKACGACEGCKTPGSDTEVSDPRFSARRVIRIHRVL